MIIVFTCILCISNYDLHKQLISTMFAFKTQVLYYEVSFKRFHGINTQQQRHVVLSQVRSCTINKPWNISKDIFVYPWKSTEIALKIHPTRRTILLLAMSSAVSSEIESEPRVVSEGGHQMRAPFRASDHPGTWTQLRTTLPRNEGPPLYCSWTTHCTIRA